MFFMLLVTQKRKETFRIKPCLSEELVKNNPLKETHKGRRHLLVCSGAWRDWLQSTIRWLGRTSSLANTLMNILLGWHGRCRSAADAVKGHAADFSLGAFSKAHLSAQWGANWPPHHPAAWAECLIGIWQEGRRGNREEMGWWVCVCVGGEQDYV